MKFKSIVRRGKHQVKRKLPDIMFIGACVGFGLTLYTMYKTAPKAHEIMKRYKDDMECFADARQLAIDGKLDEGYDYTEHDYKNDKRATRVTTVIDICKVMAPVGVTSALTILGFTGAYSSMKNVAASAAAAATSAYSILNKYRARVIADQGEEADKRYRFGTHNEIVETIEKDNKGNEVVSNKEVEVIDELPDYDFAKMFDCNTSIHWQKDPIHNIAFIRGVEKFCNNQLIANKILLLSDVYKQLGFDVTQQSLDIGWVYDPNNEKHIGDNFVDFGIFEESCEENRKFFRGDSNSLLLDFNVDGYVRDALPLK